MLPFSLRLFALFLLAIVCWPADALFPHRWVYISRSLRTDKDVEDIRQIAHTAAQGGLTGVLFAAGLDSLDLKPPEYLARLEKVKQIFQQEKLELIPSVFSAGYGGGILAHDKNLAEGLPVKDAIYEVKNGEAKLVPEVPLADGGPAVESLWTREIAVKPYRCYRISFRAKTEGLASTRPFTTGPFRLNVQTVDKRNLTPWNARIPSNTDWRDVTWGFNTQKYDKVKISIGVAGDKNGKVWLDRVRVEEVGLLNVVRRPGTPITVRAEGDGPLYEEGRDYERIVDERLNFRFDHDGPPIKLTAAGRIKPGQRLRVSYYHGFSINDGQTSICMGEPKTYEIWADQVKRMQAALAPPRYVLSMDEIRLGGTCEACRGRNMGQLLGECLRKQLQMIKEVNPKADVWTWSDMLDPNHNARDNYYLVEGDYTGSWNYVPKEMGILCWYYQKRALSLPFFSKLGFRTLGGAYYDADSLENPKGWIEELSKTPGAQGIVYTTWLNKYQLLEGFAKLLFVTEPRP